MVSCRRAVAVPAKSRSRASRLRRLRCLCLCLLRRLLVLLLCLLGDRGATEKFGLLLARLEAPMPHFGRGVDELQLYLLRGLAAHLRQEGLPHGDETLPATHHRTLQHNPVLCHLTEVRETTHGCNA